MNVWEWTPHSAPEDKSGTVIFCVGDQQSEALHLPDFSYCIEIQRMINLAREQGRRLALQEVRSTLDQALIKLGVAP